MNIRPQQAERLLSWSQVRPMIGDQGRTTWWRAIRRGEAPAPVKVSSNRVAWRESDIRQWQASRFSGEA
jgi:predicted DNA-binding transcriptional regulator AlpA